ncbi:amino acid adenylation domain-containing protein [Pseudomonas putida]|uniref:amino acid adenylation domain-containing protein n=1 Tax=Pseudomonas putida TaxID=303 RepID=UPI003905CCF1
MQALLDSVESLSSRERKALAALLKQQGVNLYGVTRIFARDPADPTPVSYAQERQWFLWQLDPASGAYNIGAALQLQGRLDIEGLRGACQALIQRHEVLRTTLRQDSDRVVQIIHPQMPFELLIEPLIGMSATSDALREHVEACIAKPFDLEQGPLLRLNLLPLGEDDHVLVLTVHHIAADGWSMPILINDLVQCYERLSQGQAPNLPALPVQYADYAIWQRNWMEAGEQARQLAYWKDTLGGEQPVLSLPTNRSRPVAPSGRGARVGIEIDAVLLQSLKALANAQGVTLFMLLLASFQTLLHRYSGQPQVRVGVPIANRNRSEVQGLIGFFVNTQVLKADFALHSRFIDVLQQVKETALQAQAHQDLPFEQLVEALQPERSMSHSPLFQVMFNHQAQAASDAHAQLSGLQVRGLEWDSRTTQFDLTLDTREHADGLFASLTYATDLFDVSRIEQMARHWRNLLIQACQDPRKRVLELALLEHDERERILGQWNQTQMAYPTKLGVYRLFEQQVCRTPDAVALRFGEQTLSYAELNRQANQLAHALRERGVGPEVLVGVAMPRGPRMLVGLLAIFKAGGAYVPLDPDYPAERLAYMIEDSGLGLLLTEQAVLARLQVPATVASLCLDTDTACYASAAAEDLPLDVDADHPAYVIYTSGSTGRPKGVTVRHGALVNFLTSMAVQPGIAASDRVLALTSLSFDIAGLELYLPLLHGASVVLLADQQNKDPFALLRVIEQQAVSVIQATPSTWRMLLDNAPPQALRGKRVISGGEALSSELAQRLIDQAGHVWNLYGPTETTIWSGIEKVTDSRQVWLGKPIGNTTFHVLDAQFDAVPVGVSGELFIGGDGLARGYLKRPGLTAERFIPNPHGHGRLYRTGDLVRYRDDGVLEYMGRIDHQLKIRGFRIELGEIEASLQGFGAVREVAVIDVDGPLGKQLAGYIVPYDASLLQADAEVQETLRLALKAHALKSMPDYMVPTHLVFIPRMPLTPNGKLDRKALPAPDLAAAQRPYQAPTSPLQQALAAIWADVLKVGQVGLSDSFFELGGHSLLASQMIGRVRQQLALEVPLRSVFEAQDLAGFAERVAAATTGAQLPAIAVVPRGEPLALSYAQQRQWVLWQLEPHSAAYNIASALHLRGALDVAALQQAFQALVARHESLRTTFVQVDGEARQVIHAPEAQGACLRQADVDAVELQATVEQLAREPFDLVNGPLIRVDLLRLEAQAHVLVMNLHHIITDGWSMAVLVNELVALYQGYRHGQAVELPALAVQYADYAAWQRQWLEAGEQARQLAYWEAQLGGEQPVLELPTDYPRPAQPSRAGGQLSLALDAPLVQALRRQAQAQGVTLFMLLLASFQTLLHRYSTQPDIRVGVPVANRTRGETEGVVGFFVNTQVHKAEFHLRLRFVELLRQVRQTALDAQAHQDLPFEQLVAALKPDRILNQNPLFQVMFNHQAEAKGAPREVPGLQIEAVDWQVHSTQFDLALDTAEHADGMTAAFTFATELYDRQTIEQMARHWRNLLQAISRDANQVVAQLPMLDDLEQQCMLHDWNATAVAYPQARLVHQLFEDQAQRHPQAPALIFADATLSYTELDQRANRLANKLREQGVGPEVLVGVAVERSLELVIGLMAVLKAGGAYVPLDPDYPSDRLAYMIEDSGIGLLLSQQALAERLPVSAAVRILCLDQDAQWLAGYADTAPEVDVRLANLAYVIYTSGSTGRPKGAGNTHEALLNRLQWMQSAYGLDASDTVLQKTPFSFDVSVWEFFWPLMTGARLAVALPGDHRDPQRLCQTIIDHQVSTLHFVPSMLQAFMASAEVEQCRSVRRVVCSGEALPAVLAQQCRERLPHAGLYNLYGPTEAAIDVTHWTCGDKQGFSVPIGQPIDNLRTHILEPDLLPAARGVNGELYLAGIGLARGYHGRPALTAERFVPDPFDEQGGRLYRTGDLARYRPDGVIDYAGRIDHQVKIRGLRIELGEIEARLAEHAQVREAVVLAQDGPSGKQLVGYVVPMAAEQAEPGSEAGQRLREQLAHFLGQGLPDYMVPAHLMLLANLPVTANGKLARNLLPAPDFNAARQVYVAPRTALEQQLASIWETVLNLPQVGMQDNFFALGGDSIIAIQVVSQARQLGLDIAPRDLFLLQTIEQLAARVGQWQIVEQPSVALHSLTEQQVQALPLEHAGVDGLYSLSPMQQGMLFLSLNGRPEDQLYINQLSVPVQGLVAERLRQAWETVVARHDVLRTGFLWQDLDEPLQYVMGQLPLPLRELDWRGRGDCAQALEALANEERERGFDLARPPLQRMLLVRLDDQRHQLIWTYHHILLDGWSTSQLMGEVLACYSGQTLDSVVPYRNYIGWLRQQDPRHSETFWKQQLASLQEPTYLADAFASGERGSGHQALYSRFSVAQTETFKVFAQSQRITLNTLVQGAWLLLLSRYSGQRSVSFGATVAGRPAALPGVQSMLGLFINTLPVIHEVDPQAQVGQWLQQLQRINLELRDHEYTALGEIQRWAGRSGQPLFDSIIVFENQPLDRTLREWKDDSLQFGDVGGSGLTDFPMDLMVIVEDQLIIEYMYLRQCFSEEAVAGIRANMEALLQALSLDGQARLGNLGLLPGAPLRALTPPAQQAPLLVHERIAQWAQQQGDAVAVKVDGQTLSFAELDRAANCLAHALIAEGVGPEVRVGVALQRTPQMIVALLAVLKAGAAYVPIDTAYPAERLSYLMEDSGVALLVSQTAALAGLPKLANVHALNLDSFDPTQWPGHAPQVTLQGENLAYVIYTSGSTGKPKGVVVSHDALAMHCQAIGERYEMTPADCELLFMSFAFDGAHERWLTALTHGGSVLLRGDELWTPEQTCQALHRHGVSVAAFPPVYLQQLIEQVREHGNPPPMRIYCFGGDAVPQASYEQAHAYLQPQYIINGYGPTETVVTPMIWKAAPQQPCGAVYAPIGTLVGQRSAYVMDVDLNPLPPGVAGELYLGGTGVARGYLNRPGLTAERFVADPGNPGGRLYRTGDLVRQREDGTFDYLGRLDNQVKVRGFRIELGEIEARLADMEPVRQAAVVVRDGPSGKQLFGYVTLAEGHAQGIAEQLRERLKQELPEYMVPAQLMVLERMPLSPNGKLDRNALPAMQALREHVAPRNELELAIARIWQDVLKVEQVGITDNFFELGGDSILSMQVVAKARGLKKIGFTLRLRDLIQKSTIAELTAVAGKHSPLLSLNAPVAGQAPMFCVHAGFGTVFDYEPLARRLNGRCQVIGIQARQLLDGAWQEASLQSMASDYVACLREQQPHGPYRLLGWSLGGTLASLMAAVLEGQGERVELLALLDSFVPSTQTHLQVDHWLDDLNELLQATVPSAQPVKRDVALPEGEGSARALITQALGNRQGATGLGVDELTQVFITARSLKRLSRELHTCQPVQVVPHSWWVAGRDDEREALAAQLGQALDTARLLACGHFQVPHEATLLDDVQALFEPNLTHACVIELS